jgi:nucleoside-diphosphate-sugar epimerase
MVSAALDGRDLVIHGDGSQTRSFCHVDDLVAGLLMVSLDRSADGEILNLGNPEEVTIRHLAGQIIRLSGSPSELRFDPRRPGDPERRRPDIGRVRARYGWQPQVGIEAGLYDTIGWFADQRTEFQLVPVGPGRVLPLVPDFSHGGVS